MEFTRQELVKINWFIRKAHDEILNALREDGRSRSEHARNAMEIFFKEGGELTASSCLLNDGILVKRVLYITSNSLNKIKSLAETHKVEQAVILRLIFDVSLRLDNL